MKVKQIFLLMLCATWCKSYSLTQQEQDAVIGTTVAAGGAALAAGVGYGVYKYNKKQKKKAQKARLKVERKAKAFDDAFTAHKARYSDKTVNPDKVRLKANLKAYQQGDISQSAYKAAKKALPEQVAAYKNKIYTKGQQQALREVAALPNLTPAQKQEYSRLGGDIALARAKLAKSVTGVGNVQKLQARQAALKAAQQKAVAARASWATVRKSKPLPAIPTKR